MDCKIPQSSNPILKFDHTVIEISDSETNDRKCIEFSNSEQVVGIDLRRKVVPKKEANKRCVLGTVTKKKRNQKSKMAEMCAKNAKICHWESYISTLFNDARFSDIVVKTKEKKFNAHRLVLAASSSALDPKYDKRSNFRIVDRREVEFQTIDMTKYRSEVVEVFLQFVYSYKTMENASLKLIMEVLELATEYKVVRLKNRCVSEIVDKISNRNVLMILEKADSLKNQELKQHALEYIRENKEARIAEKFQKSFPSKSGLLTEILYALLNKGKMGK